VLARLHYQLLTQSAVRCCASRVAQFAVNLAVKKATFGGCTVAAMVRLSCAGVAERFLLTKRDLAIATMDVDSAASDAQRAVGRHREHQFYWRDPAPEPGQPIEVSLPTWRYYYEPFTQLVARYQHYERLMQRPVRSPIPVVLRKAIGI